MVQLPCGYSGTGNGRCKVRKVLFSTMAFVHQVALDAYTMRVSDTFCRVCYSFHSSYSEIRDAILYLRPKQAFPNVVAAYQQGENENKVGILKFCSVILIIVLQHLLVRMYCKFCHYGDSSL